MTPRLTHPGAAFATRLRRLIVDGRCVKERFLTDLPKADSLELPSARLRSPRFAPFGLNAKVVP
jgi:hypothetical protein